MSIQAGSNPGAKAYSPLSISADGAGGRSGAPSLKVVVGAAVFLGLGLAIASGGIVGGLAMLGAGWANTMPSCSTTADQLQVGLTPKQVGGVGLTYVGLAGGSLFIGLGLVFVAQSRSARIGTLPAALLAGGVALGSFLAAYLGGVPLLGYDGYKGYYGSNAGPQDGYDQLRNYFGWWIIGLFTLLGLGALAVLTLLLGRLFCGSATSAGARRKLMPTPRALQPDSLAHNWRPFIVYPALAGTIMVLSSILPALWNNYPATYWMTPPGTPPGSPSWVVNGASTTWTFNNIPAIPTPLCGSPVWNGVMYVKLYTDVAVYYGFMLSLVFLGLIASYVHGVRRLLHRRLRVPLPRLINQFPTGITLGEVGLVSSVLGLYGWWFWWWSNGFSYVASQDATDPNTNLNVYARALGHMTTLTMSFLLLPVPRNSVWEGVFGIPFERAIKYHRMLGTLCWMFATCHALTWWIKWLKEGNLWHNIVANVGLLVSTTASGSHADNFTVVIAEATWLLMSFIAVVAIAFRRSHYRLFQYTHHLVWLVFMGVLTHAFSHWYYIAGGLTLYALDKVTRMVRASREAAVLHIAHAAGVTRLEVDASVFRSAGGHYAGQYAFLNIPQLGLLEWHPFTISASPQETCETNDRVVTFHIKDMGPGTWTNRLARLAIKSPEPADLVVSLDGPYGRTGHYYQRETLILVAGGIGITPIHSIAADLHSRMVQPEVYGLAGAVRRVYVVWVARDPKLFHIFANTLADILRQNPSDAFSLHLHCTAPPGTHALAMTAGGTLIGHISASGISGLEPSAVGFCDPGSATIIDRAVNFGRPNLDELFAHAAGEAQKDHAASGATAAYVASDAVTVMVCGPEPMIDTASELAFRHGFDFHSEVFHF